MPCDLPSQTFFAGMEPPPRGIPNPDDVAHAVDRSARIVIARFHRGIAPREVDFDFTALHSEIQLGALKRLRMFRYGGPKTLNEYAYLAAYQSLRDFQRAVMRRMKREPNEPQAYPLFEAC